MEKISNIAEFEQYTASKEPFYLFKHSTTCPVSAAAFDAYKSFVEDPSFDKQGIYLAVQDSRELSSHIAQVTDIRHESPQVIYFEEGKPVWSESHWKITKEMLDSAN